nr:putative ribonuclease H-like domain-containing protein [Tanacetum cinerariifolium]
AAGASSTNYVNIFSTQVNTASTPVYTDSTPVNTASLSRNVNIAGQSSPNLLIYANQYDSQIPSLEDIYKVSNDGIFISASYDAEGAVADFTNLESTVNIPSLEDIYKVQNDGIFISASYDAEGAVADFTKLESTVNIEPKKISQALEDESWVDAMQEELLQFKTQQVWILVDLPFWKKRHRQEEGMGYDEVFAPVARIEAIRIFLAFASYMGFKVYQMDVKSAFLYGKINEEVYVSQPPGFIDPKFPKKIYKVVKALYGLHQAPRACTPIETKKPLVKDAEAADVDVHLYRSMIGSLMYLISSRPDIMYAFCACSRSQVTPKTSHLQVVKRIFRYLKGQLKLGIWYPKESAFDLESYSDSDYARANLDRKSTT